MEYSKKIMQNILWNFGTKPFESKQTFIVELEGYNKEVTGQEFSIDLESPVLNSTRVVIQYMFFDDQEEEIEPSFLLEADNSNFFTQDELLYKVHNVVYTKLKDQNHKFFEGLLLWEGENPNYPEVPLYFVQLGS